MVDSNDRERFGEATLELNNVLKEEELTGVPLLIFANKEDLPNAASQDEIAAIFRLYELDRPWEVISCSSCKSSDKKLC